MLEHTWAAWVETFGITTSAFTVDVGRTEALAVALDGGILERRDNSQRATIAEAAAAMRRFVAEPGEPTTMNIEHLRVLSERADPPSPEDLYAAYTKVSGGPAWEDLPDAEHSRWTAVAILAGA